MSETGIPNLRRLAMFQLNKTAIQQILLLFLLFPLSLTLQAIPITIGSLSSNNDGSTGIIKDSLNNMEWLRWDQYPGLTHDQFYLVRNAIEGGGWSIAANVQARAFSEALLSDTIDGAAPCVAFGSHTCHESNIDILQDLITLTGGDSVFFTNATHAVTNVGIMYFENQYLTNQIGYSCPTPPHFICYPDPFSSTAVIKNNEWGPRADADLCSGDPNDPCGGKTPSWLLYRQAGVSEPQLVSLLLIGLIGFLTRRRASKNVARQSL